MKNIFLSAAIACSSLMSAETASAQFKYDLTTITAAYTPLAGATSASNGTIWTSDSHFAVPLGFSANMNGISTDTLHVLGGAYIVPQLAAIQSGWALTGTSMADRGLASGMPKSDIRYQTTGAPGNRIFKLEVFSGGFEDEYLNYGDIKDSIDFQMWVYETTNVVEFHYGSSDINYFNDYFGTRMIVGFIYNVDTASSAYEKFYLLNGTSANPAIDSFTFNPGSKGLADVPQSGLIYRFTPKSGSNPTGINQAPSGTIAHIYPTMVADAMTIDHNDMKPVTYTIMNNNGQLMKQAIAPAGRTTVDVSGYAPGIYSVSILHADNIHEIHRIVKMP